MGLISLFSFLYSQLTGMLLRAHTLTSPVSIRQFLLMTICACLKDQAQQNDTVTSYTITFISLFRKKKKKPLTSTCPWIVMYLWTLYQWSLMKGIYITESDGAFGESWDWCQRGNVVECVCSRLLWKKMIPWNHFSRSRRDRRTADWGSVLNWHPAQCPYCNFSTMIESSP